MLTCTASGSVPPSRRVPSPISRSTHLLTKPKPRFFTQYRGLGMEYSYIALGSEKERLNRNLERKVRRKKIILDFLEPCSPNVVH